MATRVRHRVLVTQWKDGWSPHLNWVFAWKFCNSLVITGFGCQFCYFSASASTYGWWMGYFLEGQVYYNAQLYKFDFARLEAARSEEDYFPRKWKKIGFDERGVIVEKLNHQTLRKSSPSYGQFSSKRE